MKLRKLLHCREVASRFSDMVHCRIRLAGFSADAFISPYGALKLPAIVIAYPDGTHHSLEFPTSTEAIVRFADRCHRARIESEAGVAPLLSARVLGP